MHRARRCENTNTIKSRLRYNRRQLVRRDDLAAPFSIARHPVHCFADCANLGYVGKTKESHTCDNRHTIWDIFTALVGFWGAFSVGCLWILYIRPIGRLGLLAAGDERTSPQSSQRLRRVGRAFPHRHRMVPRRGWDICRRIWDNGIFGGVFGDFRVTGAAQIWDMGWDKPVGFSIAFPDL